MLPDIFDRITSLRVCVQDLFNQVLAISRDETWDQIVAIENLLIQLVSVGVFKGQITT
jgi:hypothetical protein